MSAFSHGINYLAPSALRSYAANARVHSKKQIRQIARSIERFGFTNPVLISDDGEIIAGHGRVEAARLLGMPSIPTLALSHLSATERCAYVIADNKLALNAGWDKEILAIELQALVDLSFDVEVTGFSLAEIDLTLEEARESSVEGPSAPEDEIPAIAGNPITRRGDIWRLGRHRLICGDARNADDYVRLLDGERVDLIFTDPPYNVPIDGHVSGRGRVKHRKFASEEAFTAFLIETLGAAAKTCSDGAVAFVCTHWRRMGELCAAGKAVFSELKNVCVWNKKIGNGGVGGLYWSKHELVFVFKVGAGPHTNSFGLRESGRANVWDYRDVSSMSATRGEELEMPPTVKPVALVADAIKDCSKRGDIVLDAFGGSGTTLIAAEKCRRSARLIEYEPIYCDTIIRRYERMTGKSALLSSSSESFEDVGQRRLQPNAQEADK
jgi:DNA modification methylase